MTKIVRWFSASLFPLSSLFVPPKVASTKTMSLPHRSRAVTVVVAGDPRVGKTALITAAATETFAMSPPPCLPPTRLPADATPEGVPLTLVDTSSREEDRAATDAALRSADVVVLAFDAGEFFLERKRGG